VAVAMRLVAIAASFLPPIGRRVDPNVALRSE
jgi:hypothetical protein